jgi:hypothetical protein
MLDGVSISDLTCFEMGFGKFGRLNAFVIRFSGNLGRVLNACGGGR